MTRAAWLASWLVPPFGMAIAYTVLALTSNTDTTGKAWMAIGFAFVVVIWFVLRILVETAGLTRALTLGDADKLLAISNRQLARRRGAAAVPFHVYRGLALELRGDHAGALAAVEQAKQPAAAQVALLAASVRVAALTATGDVAAARLTLDGELEPAAQRVDRRLHPAPHHHAHLARARVLVAEGARDAADAELARVIDDVRAGQALRDRAKALRAAQPAR